MKMQDHESAFHSQGTSKVSSLGKQEREHDTDFVKKGRFGLDLNAEDISSSINDEPCYPCKPYEELKSRDDSECASSIGPLEERHSIRVWKEMKQNGFLSSSYGGVPLPKSCVRKTKNDGLKKKMKLAKKEQVDGFAKIAAPSGLLNGLNPGIINHVRNRKQVHSIIEAIVRSEKHETHHFGSNWAIQTQSETKESIDRKDLEIFNSMEMNRFSHFHEDGYVNTLSGSRPPSGYPMSLNGTLSLNSELTGADSKVFEKRILSTSDCISDFKLESKDNVMALRLSSCTTVGSENNSSLSNEDSTNIDTVNSLTVNTARVASQWLELLRQDIKGRLAALGRSRKRVRAVIQTELPLLMSELISNQENDSCATKSPVSGCSVNPSADVHQARWNALFEQMDKSLSEEEKQLETWFKQVKEMLLHGERTHSLQQLGELENDYRKDKAGSSEKDLAVRAAAASIYSTCNFMLSMQNLQCF